VRYVRISERHPSGPVQSTLPKNLLVDHTGFGIARLSRNIKHAPRFCGLTLRWVRERLSELGRMRSGGLQPLSTIMSQRSFSSREESTARQFTFFTTRLRRL